MNVDRSELDVRGIISNIWNHLALPPEALKSISLDHPGQGLPSSFRVGDLAQSTIVLSALSAALLHSNCARRGTIPRIAVPLRHAVTEFKSERFWKLNGNHQNFPTYPIGGIHRTRDGYVKIHDAFPHHRDCALRLLGLNQNASKEDIARETAKWNSLDLEEQGLSNGAVIAQLKSFEEWDISPQAAAISQFPIIIKRIETSASPPPSETDLLQLFPCHEAPSSPNKCLSDLKVLELSRVIAAPVAGRALAAHGADVLWVTSPNLPALPVLDPDMSRGKRTIQLDLKSPEGRQTLLDLARKADVFIQGYRPGALEALGLGQEDVAAINPNIVYANLSAYGPDGPLANRRGFDSIVQTCSGLNVAEAKAFGDSSSPYRPLPCQALDHGSGYLLATGINAALYKRKMHGGSWVVDVSLAGTMNYLRSLGQIPGRSGFECNDVVEAEAETYLETKASGLGGAIGAIRHSAQIEGVEVGWGIMPKPLGSDRAVWL